MNTKLLNRICKEMLAVPERVRMDGGWLWMTSGKAPCGTAACIGGHAVVLSRIGTKAVTPKLWQQTASRLTRLEFHFEARRVLRLSQKECQRLFYLQYWPVKFFYRYRKTSGGTVQRGKVTVDRIRHFIKTKGRE